MKLANGYGSITKLQGHRRNPYMVRITKGWQNGKQIREVLGYYPSQNKALQALSDYNKEPFDISYTKITFKDMYEKWQQTTEYNKLSDSGIKQYKYAFNRFSAIHNKSFLSLKAPQLQKCIDEVQSGYVAKRFMKNLTSKLYQLAMSQEIVTSNKSELLKIGESSATKEQRIPFSNDEISVLWNHKEDDIVKIILIYIYTGVRCQELLSLLRENLHIEEQYFEVVKSKTDAGVRIVPIADVIKPFFKHFINKNNSKYVITTPNGYKVDYAQWRRYMTSVLDTLHMEHTTHEARHTCITELTIHNVNPTIIKEIVGHKSAQSLTESVYTHIPLKVKIDAVNKIHTNLEG